MEQIPDKFKYQLLSSVNKKDTNALFRWLVTKLYFSKKVNDSLTYIQMSNLVFNDKNSPLLARVIESYRSYFILRGNKMKLDLEKVYSQHNYIWTGEKIKSRTYSKSDILLALTDEISEVYNRQKII